MHVAHKSILGEERRQSPPYPHRPSLYPLTPAPQNNSAFNNTPQHRARQCVTARCSPYSCCCYMSISGTPSPLPPHIRSALPSLGRPRLYIQRSFKTMLWSAQHDSLKVARFVRALLWVSRFTASHVIKATESLHWHPPHASDPTYIDK